MSFVPGLQAVGIVGGIVVGIAQSYSACKRGVTSNCALTVAGTALAAFGGGAALTAKAMRTGSQGARMMAPVVQSYAVAADSIGVPAAWWGASRAGFCSGGIRRAC